MAVFTVSKRSRILFALLCFFGMPCLGGGETVVQSVGYCSSGSGNWSDPAIWTPMQVPDNGTLPGTTYDVSFAVGSCLIVYLDVSVTVNQVDMGPFPLGYWDGAKDKAAKVRADGVSLTILKDARIDQLGMTNGKLNIGGTAWPSGAAGWFLTDSKVKARDYRQDDLAQARYLRTELAIDRSFLIKEWAYAELVDSRLETGKLQLLDGALSLRNRATVKVVGDFEQSDSAWSALGLELNGLIEFSVAGDVRLGGLLQCWLIDGYVPSVGEEFPLLRYKGALSGNWTDVRLPQLPAGRGWSLVFGEGAISLKVVPTA